MQAYAVMDGGGVKGAALAGCLRAAEEAGIQFVGYGGTSAGSIVALLACVGYTGQELINLTGNQLQLGQLLNEVKTPLSLLKQIPGDVAAFKKRHAWSLWKKYSPTGKMLLKNLGLAKCDAFEEKLLELVQAKLGAKLEKQFKFSDLSKLGLPPLKIVASDLSTRRPIVFSATGEDVSVLTAVRGSMSYPVIFTPLTLGDRRIVDGGLCSNLPAFVFDQERRRDKLPLIAFDLVSNPKAPAKPYGFIDFATDLLETAVEAGDFLRGESRDFYRVEIPTPEDIGTLDFDISPTQITSLINAGRAETASFIQRELAAWTQAENQVERLQALYAPEDEVWLLLHEFARNVEDQLELADGSVRASISLPTGRGTRIIVYQSGMDNDGDQDLELSQFAGCSGLCWRDGEPKYIDLADAAEDPETFGLTVEQQAKVRKDRRAMLSSPIYERSPSSDRDNPERPLLGVLSFDTDAPPAQLGWNLQSEDASNTLSQVVVLCDQWSRILTRVLR